MLNPDDLYVRVISDETDWETVSTTASQDWIIQMMTGMSHAVSICWNNETKSVLIWCEPEM